MNSEQATRLARAIKYLLYSAALTPFVFLVRFSFPYITVKTIFFRVIIEIAFILFLWLWLKGKIKLANLKGNYFFFIFAALLTIELIAAFFGESWLASLFGDLERMWGVFTVVHLFLFYFLARAFFGREEWQNFFHGSLIVSALASLYGIVQRFDKFFKFDLPEHGVERITSTLGNPTYVAIYLLFSLAFLFYFLRKNWEKKNYRYFYFIILAIDVFAFSLTNMRATYLALFAAVGLMLFLYVVLGRNKKRKFTAGVLIMAVILMLGLTFLNKDNKFIKEIPILGRLTTVSLKETTLQTRFMSWQAAWEGFQERPLLGVGMENFNIVFNKYYKAYYYNLAPTETYFDRAHNQFLNLLAESGIFALLIYLGFPFFIIYYLIKGCRAARLALAEVLIFSGITAAYFIHVFFVFDDINSFLLFTALIAFVEFNYRQNNLLIWPAGQPDRRSFIFKAGAVIVILFALFSIFRFNLRTLQAARLTAYAFNAQHVDLLVDYYNKALDLDIIPDENISVNYINYLVEQTDKLDQAMANPKIKEILDNAVKRADQAINNDIKKKPNDAFLLMKKAQLYNFQSLFFQEKKYAQEAEADIKKALALSPERLQFYYVLADVYIIEERPEEAVKALEESLKIEKDFSETYYHLGRAYLAAGDFNKAYDNLIVKAIKEKNYSLKNTKLLALLGQELAKKKDYSRAVEAYGLILNYEPNRAEVMAAMAACYLHLDKYDQAIEMAEKAGETDPSFADESAQFIGLIKAGQTDLLKRSSEAASEEKQEIKN